MLRYVLILSVTGMFVTSCNSPDQEIEVFSMEQAGEEIELRLREYEAAMRQGDIDAFGELYAEDAEIFHDGRPSTIGRDSIRKTFQGWMRDSVTEASFTTTGLWGDESLLVEQGTGYFAHATGKWKSTGHYLLVWKKVDGNWQIFKDSWFSD